MPVPLVVDAPIPHVERAAIEVDAQRTEAAWQSALPIPGPFVAFQPTPDAAPTGSTEMWVLADDEGLHVYLVAHDPEPDRVRGALGRRDTRYADDWVGLYLDPLGTAQRGYLFVVNPAGVLGDGTVTPRGDDVSWDGTWSAAARRTGEGYEVELSIPWRTVRHRRNADQMGILALRHISRLGEKSSWPRLDPDVAGALVQEGVLRGPGKLPRDAGLDLMPEVTFRHAEGGPAGQAALLSAYGVSPGLTVRYRPAPSVSLLGTVNPDFSQVESDVSQVSVNRRNALYFPETRPFFLDGQEWFAHPLGELVYTRTMAQPYGGLRFTLEPPKTAVAGLVVQDAAPTPSVSEAGGWTAADLRGHSATEVALRLRRDLGRDGQVGALLTDRVITGAGLANHLGGVDARLRLSDRATADASALLSHTSFADGTAALAPAASGRIEYSSRHPYFGTWAHAIAPGFRAENGYLPQADRIGGGSWAGWGFRTPSPVVPSGSVTPVSVWYGWTFEQELRDLGAEMNGSLQLGNGTRVDGGGSIAGTRWMEAWLPSRSGWLSVGGPWTRWLEASGSVSGGLSPYYDPVDPHSGRSVGASGDLVVRPFAALSLGGSTTWERFVELDGAVRYDGVVARARAELFLSRRVFGRVIADTSTFTDQRRGEVLLGWEQGPGTAMYVGGTTTLEEDPSWSVFAKAGVALTP